MTIANSSIRKQWLQNYSKAVKSLPNTKFHNATTVQLMPDLTSLDTKKVRAAKNCCGFVVAAGEHDPKRSRSLGVF